MRSRVHGERGVALILTLLVVTLLSIIVTEFTFSTEVHSHLARNARNAVQAEFLARSGVVLAELALQQDVNLEALPEAPKPAIDALTDPWALPFPPMTIGDGFGTTSYVVLDEHARFNLNALTTREPVRLEMTKEIFQGILRFLGIDENLLFPVLDWVDGNDSTEQEAGAESLHYLGLNPPYRPREAPFLALEEIVLVRGFESLTPAQWTAFRDVVTVLPSDELAINPNTASQLALSAILASSDAIDVADAMVRERETEPFRNAEDLARISGFEALRPAIKTLFRRLQTNSFTIFATGTAANVERTLAVTVERDRRRDGAIRHLRTLRHYGSVPLTSPGGSDGIPSDLL